MKQKNEQTDFFRVNWKTDMSFEESIKSELILYLYSIRSEVKLRLSPIVTCDTTLV